jgi:DNA polymerase-3 subunit alpha
MQPARLTDLVACLTLASPLAQASGMTERYLSAPTSGRVPEDLQDILGETAGWILYEEQVMQIAQRIGGFDSQEAWDFCEAIQADALQRLQQMRPRFLSGALEQGITLRYAERVLDTVMAARVGGQRRGQATAQALVAYRTAWLLTNHPAATLVGLLNNSVGQGAKQQRILAMAVEQGCRIVKVDVNRSEEGYLIEDGAIRLAMSHVPSVGEATAAALVAERHRGGDFKSVQDVLMRVPSLHRLQVDAMVDAGAFEKLCDSSLAVKSREEVAAVRVASKRPTVFSHGGSQVGGAAKRRRRLGAQMMFHFEDTLPLGSGSVVGVVAPCSEADGVIVESHPLSPALRRAAGGERRATVVASSRMWVAGTLFGRVSGLGKRVEEV